MSDTSKVVAEVEEALGLLKQGYGLACTDVQEKRIIIRHITALIAELATKDGTAFRDKRRMEPAWRTGTVG